MTEVAKQIPAIPEGWVYEPPASKKASWIGFDRRVRENGHPETGEVREFRPSVFVREFSSILVKAFEVQTATVRGERFTFAAVKFDAASLGVEGFEHDFNGNVAEGPALALLQEAYSRQAPVAVVLETVRRAQEKKAPHARIDVTTPIWTLRGADSPTGSGNAQITLNNTRGVVAAVAPASCPKDLIFSHECTTDPAEWQTLRRNYDATRAPAGWVLAGGGITRSASAASQVDVQALVEAVAARLEPQLAALSSTGAGSRPSSSRRGQVEATPWYPKNSDGSVNLGSYVVSKERCAFRQAVGLLEFDNGGPASEEEVSLAWQVAARLLWAADAVQAKTLGVDRAADRSAKSHSEAAQWVSLVIDTFPTHTFPGRDADSDTLRQWIQGVAQAAVPLFRQAAGNAQVHLDGPREPRDRAGQSTPTPAAGGTEEHVTGAESGEPASDVPELRERYQALLARTRMTNREASVEPLLAKTFDGARSLEAIPAGQFDAALDRWEADPEAFVAAGRSAYMEQTGAGAA